MFTYAFAKGVRLGYLPPGYAANAARGYRGILQYFVQNNANGSLTISDTVSGTALGGNATMMEVIPITSMCRKSATILAEWERFC